jgi:DNA-binding MarR family transcriptional regulator
MTGRKARDTDSARREDEPRVAGRVMARLTQAIDWFDNSLQNVVASSGFEPLHRTQSMIMMHIALGVSRPADIAREMGLTRQNVHHMAKSLIDAGIIDSAPDPDDPRRSLYRLSEKSSDMRNLALDTMTELEAVLEQRIGTRTLNGLRTALEADWGEEVASADELTGSRRPAR